MSTSPNKQSVREVPAVTPFRELAFGLLTPNDAIDNSKIGFKDLTELFIISRDARITGACDIALLFKAVIKLFSDVGTATAAVHAFLVGRYLVNDEQYDQVMEMDYEGIDWGQIDHQPIDFIFSFYNLTRNWPVEKTSYDVALILNLFLQATDLQEATILAAMYYALTDDQEWMVEQIELLEGTEPESALLSENQAEALRSVLFALAG